MATKSPNMISFGPSQQDLQAQQIDLARRQQIADALRTQSLAPIEQQTVSGRVIPISPWQGAFKLATAYLANKGQEQNAVDEAKLGQAAAQRQAAALRALAPAGTFDQDTQSSPRQPVQLGMGLTDESMGEVPPQAPAAPQVDQGTRSRWAKILAANNYDPALAKKLIENELTTPEETRNLLAQGIDPTAYGKARLGKELAGGVTNVAAGTSVFNPSTGQFVAAAPDFGTGTQGSFGPNGPQINRIQGSENIAQLAGEKARQEAGGRAGFNTITVNTPNGPVLLTEEQAAKMAGGGQQPQSNAPVNFTASNGVSINMAGRTPQQIIQAAQASGDPQVMQAVGEWMRSGGQQPQGQPGIPLMSKAQEALQVGQAENQVALARDLAKNAQSPEAQQKIADAQSVVGLLQEATPFIQSATSSTVGNLRDAALGLVGKSTNAGQDAARLAAIGGQLVSKMPKMSGPQSDKDVLLYKEMAGRIGDPTVPSDIKQAAADTILRLNQKYLQVNQGSMATQALKQTQGTGKAPSIDDLLNKYGGH
jgi:hypothetical protein